MRKRILIGSLLVVGLAAMVAADLALGRPLVGVVLLSIMALVGQGELVRMMRGAHRSVTRLAQLVGAAVIGVRVGAHELGHDAEGFEATLMAFVIGCLVLLVQSVLRLQFLREEEPRAYALDVAAGVLSLAYVVLPMTIFADLALRQEGGTGTLFAGTLVLISKCGDIGGYVVGTLFGRHRVMPNVSPKKSWEGSFGGLALTLGLAFAAWRLEPQFFGHLEWPGVVILGVVINVATQLGDFAESMLKRSCEVKDSADLLPTFGGALDIIDSLVFAAPAAALVLRFGSP